MLTMIVMTMLLVITKLHVTKHIQFICALNNYITSRYGRSHLSCLWKTITNNTIEFVRQRGSIHGHHLDVYHSQFAQQRVRGCRLGEDDANGDEYVSDDPCRQRHDTRLGYSAATSARHIAHGRI